MRYRSLLWDTAALALNSRARLPDFGISPRARTRRLPFRLLRYWFVDRMLREEAVRKGRRLRVLEIGLHRGQMKAFVDGVPDAARPYACWDGADCALDRPVLDALAYGRQLEVDLDCPDSLAALTHATRGARYDAIILLHVLEHLAAPEQATAALAPLLAPGGVVLGGFPVVPHSVRRIQERRLRRSARPRGHVSAFSPARLHRLARAAGLQVEFLSGAFGLRASGSRLEDSASWLRLNLLIGALAPSWPGELYWKLRAAPASLPRA